MPELKGAFDLHVHCAPDVRARKTTGTELAAAAVDASMGGLLLKNHHTSTVPLAAALGERFPELYVAGGLALNEWIGGLNPAATEAALAMGAREIWLPTLSAENERVQRGQGGTGIAVLDQAGRLKPEVREIIRLVGEQDVMLGTGHMSPCEIAEVVREAKSVGLRKIVVTHPEIRFIQLPVSLQKELSGPGVFFERCFARSNFALDWDELAASIREVGVESTALGTDLGQPDSPDPVSGFALMLSEYRRCGFSEDEIERMACRNAAYLLGVS
jgi:hypothetical protein